MKHRILFLLSLPFILLSFSISTAQDVVGISNLMPVPAKIIRLEGKFRLDSAFSITVNGNPNKRLYGAAARMLHHLSGRTGFFFSQYYVTNKIHNDSAQFVINCKQPGKLELREDESYTLIITTRKVELSAETDLGDMHGLETFVQLLSVDSAGYYFPAVKIIDQPRFPWRGLMIDVARHFMPVDVIKRNLDAMEFVKLNVLHLHLSDDQGFRVQSKVFPDLTKLGSNGQFYTQDQIKDIISYADARGIRIIPEFDMPGHTQSWFASHPELASAPGPYHAAHNWSVHNAVFNPTINKTYIFLNKFYREMSKLFKDEYIHIGGDENNGKDWKANKSIQTFIKRHHIASAADLQTYFCKRVLRILTRYHKKMIGWDEILQPGMPHNIVIQSWRGQKALFKAAREGYMGLLSNGYYIDLYQPASYHYLVDPIPPDSILPEDAVKNIVGGEATMWSELVTPENIDSRIWPRVAAIAERFWSPDSVRNVSDMYRRLKTINYELEDYGTTQFKNNDMMLRRMTCGNDISALKLFVDIIEPVKGYKRHSLGVKYNAYSPMTRVADAAQPESETAREFNSYVDKYLNGDKSAEGKVTSMLNMWKNNYSNLTKTLKAYPILKEMLPMAENLNKLAVSGLEALSYIDNSQKPSGDWEEENSKLLNDSKKSSGQCELMIVPAISKLIDSVSKDIEKKNIR